LTGHGNPNVVFSLFLLARAGMYAADTAWIVHRQERMGTLVIRTAPGAKVTVEQVRHEFGLAPRARGVFSGRHIPGDIAKWEGGYSPSPSTRRAGSRFQGT